GLETPPFFEHRDAVALLGQAQRGDRAAEAAPYDEDVVLTHAASISPAEPRTTSCARASNGVGSRFTIASFPQWSSVSSGSPATGQTSSDVPTTRSRPAFCASATARSIAAAGSSSPNITTPGLRTTPQSAHRGSGSSSRTDS